MTPTGAASQPAATRSSSSAIWPARSAEPNRPATTLCPIYSKPILFFFFSWEKKIEMMKAGGRPSLSKSESGIGGVSALIREAPRFGGPALLAFLFVPFPLQFALFIRFSAAERRALHSNESRAR